jgi:hypothetical protein
VAPRGHPRCFPLGQPTAGWHGKKRRGPFFILAECTVHAIHHLGLYSILHFDRANGVDRALALTSALAGILDLNNDLVDDLNRVHALAFNPALDLDQTVALARTVAASSIVTFPPTARVLSISLYSTRSASLSWDRPSSPILRKRCAAVISRAQRPLG